jgi:hypothetical protein
MEAKGHGNRASLLSSCVVQLVLTLGIPACSKQKNQNLFATAQVGKSGVKDPSTGLELEISLSRNVYQFSSSILLVARFRNSGKSPLTIVNMVDGSSEGMRYPKYTIHLVNAEGEAVPRKREGRCDNVNPLYEGDVVQVLPQQTVDPFAKIDEYHFRPPLALEKMFNITKPGRYRVWVEYSYTGSDQIRLKKCVYQYIDEKLVDKSKLEQIRPLHIPMPAVLPLEIAGLKSNEVIFNIIS